MVPFSRYAATILICKEKNNGSAFRKKEKIGVKFDYSSYSSSPILSPIAMLFLAEMLPTPPIKVVPLFTFSIFLFFFFFA